MIGDTTTVCRHSSFIGISVFRVVRPWNALPESVVSSPSVKAFESRLDEVWKNQPVRFDYKEELQL